MKSIFSILVGVPVAFAALFTLIAVLGLGLAWPFMWLWNYGVCAGLPSIAVQITYWPAFCLFLVLGMFLAGRSQRSK